MTSGLALLAAFASMVLYGLASVSQAAAARRASGPKVVVHPLYVVGMAADLLAWAASLLALVRLPLVVVQPIIAGGVAVAVLLAVPMLRIRLVRRDAVGVALTTVGLVVVAAAAGDPSTSAPPGWFGAALIALTVLCAVLAAVTYRAGAPTAVALVSGLCFAGAALAGRAIAPHTDLTTTAGLVAVLTDPLAWAVVALGVVGTMTYARALERGGLGLATALMFVVEAVVPSVVGAAVLGDAVRAGWWPAAVAGLLVAVGGCVVLALSPTQALIGE